MIDNKKIEEIIERLSPIERSVIPHLKSSFHEIKKKSSLDETSLIRALRFLELKGILKISQKERNIVDLGTNGIYYKKNHLPERTLLLVLDKNNHLPIEEAQKTAKLSDNEFKVSLGVLRSEFITKRTTCLNAHFFWYWIKTITCQLKKLKRPQNSPIMSLKSPLVF